MNQDRVLYHRSPTDTHTDAMNIFVTARDTATCAREIPDKLLPKMILETAQLLCTAHHVLDADRLDETDPTDAILYRKTHENHPCGVWVRQTAANYQWTYLYLLALGTEFRARRGKAHTTILKLRNRLARSPYNAPYGPLTPPPACMPHEYKRDDERDTWPCRSYQEYLTFGKPYITGPEAWSWLGVVPAWYTELREETILR